MSFRNVDGSSEMLESGSVQFYSRILVANKSKRQTRVDWQYGTEFPIFYDCRTSLKVGRI